MRKSQNGSLCWLLLYLNVITLFHDATTKSKKIFSTKIFKKSLLENVVVQKGSASHNINTRRPIINAHGTCVERIYFVKLSNSAPVCDIMFARFYEMKLNCKY